MPDAVPASLGAALEALTRSLSSAGVPAVIIGGVAASMPDLVPSFDTLVAQARSRR